MRAYHVSVNLKLGLIGLAVIIAISSLWYTNLLVQQLRDRESAMVQLWARALEELPKSQQARNPYRDEFRQLESDIPGFRSSQGWSGATVDRLVQAIAWAQSMPPTGEVSVIVDAFLTPNAFTIPALVYDSTASTFSIWHNLDIPETSFAGLDDAERADLERRLFDIQREMELQYRPIPIEVTFEGDPPERLVQRLYYGESDLVSALRWFPYIQLGFVALFVVIGYVGFSYVRRSEQSSLWVGMAKEAAHQLGTPISSLMGWNELLRMQPDPDGALSRTSEEIEEDINRLNRVANRFSDIGSLPKLERQPLGPVIESTTDYMRRRIPRQGSFLRINVAIPPSMEASVNAELFEWVIENLLKNAMDAIDTERGRIDIVGTEMDGMAQIDISDTGKGIDRRQFRNVFRPGYSTKKRGWGLGLSLAKRIVEDYHGGALTLHQSKPGAGTTFRIRIPIT